MYHMVSELQPGQKMRGLRVSPQAFEKQLSWLSKKGFHFATMSDVARGAALPEKTVVLTFDDGFEDNYTKAMPIMQKYGARGTLYLVIDRHHRDWSVSKKAHHDSGELAREPKLSDQQVREMVESGLFELGGHTLTHCNLNSCSEENKRREIEECRIRLQSEFNTPVNSFAYPFGIYSSADIPLVRDAGFTTATTTAEGIDLTPDNFQLKRIKVSGKDNFLAFTTRIRIGFRGYI